MPEILETDSHIAAHVQRQRPFGRLRKPQILLLPIEQIHPVVRIAHRRLGALAVPERILFDHELVLILAGQGRLLFEDHAYAFQAHDLLFIPPFMPHQFLPLPSQEPLSSQEGEHLAIHFDFAPNVPVLADQPDERAPYQVRLTHALEIPPLSSLTAGHRIETACFDLLREWASLDPLAKLAVANHLTSILIALLRTDTLPHLGQRQGPVSAQNQRRVAHVIAYLKEHFAQPLTAADLAASAGLSGSRLNTLFRQMTGYSPLEYLRRMRIDEARRLLAEKDLSVKEIAFQTGFEDSYHFSKVFHRVDGLSPTRYREALLAGRLEK